MTDVKRNIISGSFWSVIGHFGSLIVLLITNIWLANLLSPKEFGQAGIVLFFCVLAGVLTESGLGGALVRKIEVTSDDYSTALIINIVISSVLYFLIFLTSDLIASYYRDPILRMMLRISGLAIIFDAFQLVQNSRLIRQMKFKRKFTYRFISVFVASVVGITLAYQGAGVWTLVVIQVLTSSLNMAMLWIGEGFFLNLTFSNQSFRELYKFGVNTTLASLITTTFENIYQVVLAKTFSVAQTGYFYQAKKLQDVPMGVLNMLTQGVIFSSLSKLQADKEEFVRTFNKIMLYFMSISGLILILIYLFSNPVILIIYGEKWIDSVFYMQILSIASFFLLQERFNRLVFKVFDKTRDLLYLEIAGKIFQTAGLFIGIYLKSIEFLMFSFAVASGLSYVSNYIFSRNHYVVTMKEILVQLKIVFAIILTILIFKLIISYLSIQPLISLLLIPVVLLVYVLFLHFMKLISIPVLLTYLTKHLYVKKTF
jgi:O-antigen/teichoic acid export membrane protein